MIHEMLKKGRNGDIIVASSLDRFGRDHDEITKEWRMITRQNGVSIVASDMLLLDTRQKEQQADRRIHGRPCAEQAYVSHIEREKTRCRQTEGIRLTRERGTKFGRPAKLVAAIYP